MENLEDLIKKLKKIIEEMEEYAKNKKTVEKDKPKKDVFHT